MRIFKGISLAVLLAASLMFPSGPEGAGLYAPPKWSVSTDTGIPASGYRLYFYSAGTTTPKDTYTTAAQTATNTNPVILDARGEADIWLNGAYKVVLKTSADVTVWTVDNYGSDVSTGSNPMSGSNLITNGSFEIDADSNGTPDNWTLTPYVTGTVARSASNQSHAAYVMTFTSVGGGGGTASTDIYAEVSPLQSYIVSYSIYSTAANVRNVVDIQWYTSAKSLISTTNLYDDSTTNPTSATLKTQWATPPATARFAKLVFTGCHSSVATAGTTYIDGVSLMATVLPVPTGSANKYLKTDGTTPSWSTIPAQRNYVINGCGRVQQRTAPTITAASQYGAADRMLIGVTGATGLSGTVNVLANAGFTSGVGYGAVAASWTTGNFTLKHRIEAQNAKMLNGKTITVSGKFYQDTGGARNIKVNIGKASAFDNFATVNDITTNPTSANISIPSATATAFSWTGTLGPSDGTNGIQINIYDADAANTVSNKNYLVGDLQVEVGSVATDFEYEPYTVTLAKCQRYYFSDLGGYGPAMQAYCAASAYYFQTIPFPVPMRISPTVTKVGTYTVSNSAQPVLLGQSPISYVLGAIATASGNAQYSVNGAAGVGITASAEL